MKRPDPSCPSGHSDLTQTGDPVAHQVTVDGWNGEQVVKTQGYTAQFRCNACGWTGPQDVDPPRPGRTHQPG